MTAEEMKQYKAKQLRYKKPIARYMNLDFIREEIDFMADVIYDIQWFIEDEQNLVNALAGDEDEAWEFKMAFSDLAAELDQFQEDMNEAWIPEYFDELFPAAGADCFGGFLGFDTYEQDYYGLDRYESEWGQKEAEKRLCRMTKKELLEAVGACLRVYQSFVALKYRFDCLDASLKIIQETNLEGLKLVKAIEEQYEKADEESWHFEHDWSPAVKQLDSMLAEMPREYWL
ncbi:MAG: hypothetical protein J6N19_05605 [Clostridium sp.]|nr:hypothetical protein [Clostridium sp.]